MCKNIMQPRSQINLKQGKNTLIAPSPQPAAINFPSGENLTQNTSDVLSEIVILGTNLYFLELFSESSIRIIKFFFQFDIGGF